MAETTEIITAPVTAVSTSKQYSLDYKDLGKGALVAAITPLLYVAQQIADTVFTQQKPISSLHLDWRSLLMASVGAGVAYLIKNFLTPAQTIIQPSITKSDEVVK